MKVYLVFENCYDEFDPGYGNYLLGVYDTLEKAEMAKSNAIEEFREFAKPELSETEDDIAEYYEIRWEITEEEVK